MTVKEYLQLLKSHDWYFEMSGDPRVWRKGQSERDRILSIANGSELFERIFKDWMLYRNSKRAMPTLSEYEEE